MVRFLACLYVFFMFQFFSIGFRLWGLFTVSAMGLGFIGLALSRMPLELRADVLGLGRLELQDTCSGFFLFNV